MKSVVNQSLLIYGITLSLWKAIMQQRDKLYTYDIDSITS